NTSYFTWIITILCPSLLITKYLFILKRISCHIYLFIQNRLLAKVSQRRPIEVIPRAPAEHPRNTLLISQICSYTGKTDDNAMFGKTPTKSASRIGSHTKCGKITLWRSIRGSRRLLYRRNNNPITATSEI